MGGSGSRQFLARFYRSWRCINSTGVGGSGAFGTFETSDDVRCSVAIRVPAQPVDATQALNLSAGLLNRLFLAGFGWSGYVPGLSGYMTMHTD
jgi:hypothetical protein